MSHIIAGFSDVIFPNACVFWNTLSSQLVQNIIVSAHESFTMTDIAFTSISTVSIFTQWVYSPIHFTTRLEKPL